MAGGIFIPDDFPPLHPSAQGKKQQQQAMTICFGSRPAMAIHPDQKTGNPNNQPQTSTKEMIISTSSTGKVRMDKTPPSNEQKQQKSNSTASGSTTDLTKSESLVDLAFKGKLPLQKIGVKNGMPSICFNADDKSRFLSNVKHIVIVKFSHGRPVFNEFNEFLVNMKFRGKFQVSAYDIKHVFVEFDIFEDFARLWMRKSTFIGKYKARFFIWDEDFCPSMETSVSPVWIYLPGLPLYLLTEEALLAIASIIGRPLWLDQRNITHQKTDYAVFCVALDAREQRPKAIWIDFDVKGKSKKGFIQKVIYGEVPAYCGGCFHLGHSTTSCRSTNNSMNDDIRNQKDLQAVEGRAKTTDDARRKSGATLVEQDVCMQISVEEKGTDDPAFSRNQESSKGEMVMVQNCSNGQVKSTLKSQPVGGPNSVTTEVNKALTLDKVDQNLDTNAAAVIAKKPFSATATNIADAHDKAARNLDGKSATDSKNEALNVLHDYVVGCVSGANTVDVDSVGVKTPTKNGKSCNQKIQNVKKEILEATNQKTTTQFEVEKTPYQKMKTQSPQSWHDSVEQNIPMDYSTPPFQNCTDGLVEKIEDSSEEDSEENESSEEGEDHSNDEELDLKQKLEKFDKVCKERVNIRNTRIIYKKHVLPDVEKGYYSEAEEAELNPEDFNIDPLMGKDDEVVRFSKLIESRVKLVRQRSSSPVGRVPPKLEYLKTKLGYLQLAKKSATLMSTDKYERTQQIKDTRQSRRTEKEWTTPKRRGRPPKAQKNCQQKTERTSPQKIQDPRKRGRPKKKV